MESLKEWANPNPEESLFLDEIDARAKELGDDYYARIRLFFKELQDYDSRFGDRIAVERALKFKIGHSYEWLATYILKEAPPLERSRLFKKAILWYQAADELTGYYTDFGFRQAEACFGCAVFLSKGGLEDMAREYSERGVELISRVSNGKCQAFNK